ncbi:hypothetical protein CCACVL1_30581 [Corchorus capsularis]|uniref:Uncharacterized protein n=1 Tax=Corchorus capsularis TaxID=210143 RepID=A0A1R3FWL9_COCAP|nr:hypothetical protein CCACVL1_30581 [Corchorus capsularis]
MSRAKDTKTIGQNYNFNTSIPVSTNVKLSSVQTPLYVSAQNVESSSPIPNIATPSSGKPPLEKISSIEACFEKQKTLSVERISDGKVMFGNFTFDQDISRQELAACIVLHEYPISMVEHVFKRFVASLQPLFKMVSHNTIREDIMKIYNSEKAKLLSMFEMLNSRVAITTDMWTLNQRKGHMSIPADFLDDSWTLQSHILRFVYEPAPHGMRTDGSFDEMEYRDKDFNNHGG